MDKKAPSRSYRSYLTPYAQKLRKNMTPQEKRLWYNFLRTYPLQFRRQVPADKYILDFYCHQAKLAVELDGTQHYESKEQAEDKQRTEIIGRLGIKVVRFDNFQVDRYLGIVCEEIDRMVKERVHELKGK